MPNRYGRQSRAPARYLSGHLKVKYATCRASEALSKPLPSIEPSGGNRAIYRLKIETTMSLSEALEQSANPSCVRGKNILCENLAYFRL